MAKKNTEEKNTDKNTDAVNPTVIRSRKISPKSLIDLKVDKALIYGLVTGSEVKVHPMFGESLQFLGAFELKADNFIVKSKQLYLPSLAEEDVKEALDSRGEGDGEIAFAIELRKVPSEKSTVGYTWEFEHKLPMVGENPLRGIQLQLGLVE